MKRILSMLIIVVILDACTPKPEQIAPYLQQTLAAWPTQTAYPTLTPNPTYTPYPTFTPAPTYTPHVVTATPSPTPVFDRWTAEQVADALIAAGLEFENPEEMEEFGILPVRPPQAIHFYIPSLCADCGGRLFAFTSETDLLIAKQYYEALGEQGTVFFSWVFVRDNILLQINGDLPEVKAEQYKAVLEGLKD